MSLQAVEHLLDGSDNVEIGDVILLRQGLYPFFKRGRIEQNTDLVVFGHDEQARVCYQCLRQTVDHRHHLFLLRSGVQSGGFDKSDLGKVACLFFFDRLACQVVTWQGSTVVTSTQDGELGARPCD